jgi:hypothetical protein
MFFHEEKNIIVLERHKKRGALFLAHLLDMNCFEELLHNLLNTY